MSGWTRSLRTQASTPDHCACMMPGMAAKNKLSPKAVAAAKPTVMKKAKKKKQPVPEYLKGTRMAKEIRNGERNPPHIPKGKSLKDIVEMDQDDPALKMKPGRPRTTGTITPKQARSDEVSWHDAAKHDRQKRFNERRARARKGEVVTVKAVEVLDKDKKTSSHTRKKGVYDEDVVIAEGLIDLDDWDDEELIRGYRRNRNGKFGVPPTFVPREIQQEIFRRIVSRGDRKMRAAYLVSVEQLTELAEGASSEKVRLESIRELMNRVVGKVPDRVHIATEQPWEQFLADSIQPIGDEWEPEPMGPDADVPRLPTGADYSGKAPTEAQD